MSTKNVNVFLTCTNLLKQGACGRLAPTKDDKIVKKIQILFPEVPVDDIVCDCGTAYRVMLEADDS